jgi:hypothetical protein
MCLDPKETSLIISDVRAFVDCWRIDDRQLTTEFIEQTDAEYS